MSWTRSRNAVVLGTAAALLLAAQAETEVLLRDDFDAPALDNSKWSVPTGQGTFLGRTQIRPPSATLSIAGGSIRLQLDTYNPWSRVPGDSFLGSEIDTVDTYEIGDGLIVEARMRFVSPLPGGLVGSLFSYGLSGGIRDEIDFELLSNDLVAAKERVLTNVFDDHDFNFPGIHTYADVAGLDLDGFHVYRIEWFPGKVIWYVDNVFLRKETGTVPDDPQNIRLNFWAPDAFFTAAYDESLVPAAAPEDNAIYFYEVDWVKIRRPLSLSSRLRPWAGTLLAVLALLAVAAAIFRRSRA